MSGLLPKDVAPGRTDHMQAKPPEPATERRTPRTSALRLGAQGPHDAGLRDAPVLGGSRSRRAAAAASRRSIPRAQAARSATVVADAGGATRSCSRS